MKVYLATDHAGFALKEEIKKYLLEKSFEVEDLGAYTFTPGDDYPNFIAKVGEAIENNPDDFGIIFGKSGAGELIVANKFKNVRAFEGFSIDNVRLARIDNDANVLSLGSLFEDFAKAKELVEIFLKTAFSNDPRHVRRIEEIRDIEDKNYA
jgi:ribose 5-phosphate isomerase B